VMGAARLRDDVVEPEIARDRDAEMFLISTENEEQLTRGYTLGAGFKLAFGTLFAGAFPVGLVLGQYRDVGAAFQAQLPTCLAFAAAYAAVILVYYLVLVYNGLVSVRARQRMAESMIEVQLRRRFTLIPRLVECVKGYTRHEKGTQERLAELRAGKDDAAGQNRALRTIFALAEAYPELDADENFAALQRELVNTEDKIALAREFHNASVTALRNRIETMPDALVAKLTGFKAKDWYAAKDFERTAVRIDLGS
jgi:LemA protein